MARTFSDHHNTIVNKVSAEEFPLVLIMIEHDDLASPIRVVADRADITSNGELFTRFAFKFERPNDPENGIPEARLVMDNVGRDMMQWIEIADWNKPTIATMYQVMRSAPDDVEYTVIMRLEDIHASQLSVSAKLGFEDLLSVPGVRVNYTPASAVGLF